MNNLAESEPISSARSAGAPAVVNVVDSYFGDEPGGMARFAHDLCLQQPRWGYRPILICIAKTPDAPELE